MRHDELTELLSWDEPDYAALATMLTERDLDVLAGIVDSGDDRLARRALYAAALVGREAKELLARVAENAGDPLVREAAIHAMRKLPVEEDTKTIMVDDVSDGLAYDDFGGPDEFSSGPPAQRMSIVVGPDPVDVTLDALSAESDDEVGLAARAAESRAVRHGEHEVYTADEVRAELRRLRGAD